MERPTLSNSWSRVSRLTPVLRPRVEVQRQLFRGEPWYILHDPVSNSFFRLNPVAYHFVGLLDGRRTVDEVWRLVLERYADDAPTQDEVIALLGQLNQSNLLRVELPADAEPLLKRSRKRKVKHWGGQALNILFVRIPLFNPEPILKWLAPVTRPLLNRWTLILWFLWLGYCLYAFLPHLGDFAADARSVLAPANWFWALLVFLVTKTIHELGHGLVCKRFGGVVPEVGIMLLVLFPAPFVDATSAWNLPSKWKRLLVGAAGMMFELAIAGAAILVWVHQIEAGQTGLVRQIAYNTIFLASITTLLFNANPLLRFDGYYMLSDVLEIPNMYERSRRMIYYLVQRYAFGVKNVYPVSSSPAEKSWLIGYGIAAQIYRFFLLAGIILFIVGQLFTLGLLLAFWSLIAWVMVPIGKFIHFLWSSPVLGEKRPRAIGVTLAAVAAIVFSLGLIPVDQHRRTQGVIESTQRSIVAIQSPGFVREVRIETNQPVSKGDVLIVGDDPHLRARQRELAAEIRKVQSQRTAAMVDEPVKRKMRAAQLEAMRKELAEIDRRLEELTIRSPQDGTFLGRDPKRLLGQYVKRGEVVGQVLAMDDLRITAMVGQSASDSNFLSKGAAEQAEVRFAGFLDRPFPTRVLRAFDSGSQQLPHPALGQPGGGQIALDPQDENGQTALDPHFEVWLQVPAEARDADAYRPHPRLLPGERVYVRFTLAEKRPLGVQWFLRFFRLFMDRAAQATGFERPI